MDNLIDKKKLEKYFKITSKALEKAKNNVNKDRKKESDEIIEMVSNYLNDSKHFEKEGNFVDAFAAINYAHGWLDSGVRLGIFDVNDDKLFTIR